MPTNQVAEFAGPLNSKELRRLTCSGDMGRWIAEREEERKHQRKSNETAPPIDKRIRKRA